MSRLNSPALASSRRSLECKNAVGDELARTRSQLAAAEAKVRKLETPPDGYRGSTRRQSGASDLLSFDDAATSTPTASCIGSNIPVSSSRRSEVSRQIQMADAGAAPVTVTIRVVNDALASARQVTLQPSSSRAGSVLAQLKKSVDEFAGGKVIVRATAGGWERISKADQLSVSHAKTQSTNASTALWLTPMGRMWFAGRRAVLPSIRSVGKRSAAFSDAGPGQGYRRAARWTHRSGYSRSGQQS
jgi:hypothetical protein